MRMVKMWMVFQNHPHLLQSPSFPIKTIDSIDGVYLGNGTSNYKRDKHGYSHGMSSRSNINSQEI